MYFSTNRGTCEQTQRESKVMHECEGNREKSPNRVFVPFFFVTIKRKTVYYPPVSKGSPTRCSQLLGK